MGKKAVTVLPATLDILIKMGEQIKLARLRRNLSVDLTAEGSAEPPCGRWKKVIRLSLSGSMPRCSMH